MRKRYPIVMGAAGALFILLLVFWLHDPLFLSADTGVDFYHESLRFDSEGNLLMTTRDKRAVSPTRYKTLGWTIKRTKDASGSAQTIRLKLEGNGEPRLDPSDPDYIFTYFKCPKEVIFEKIGAASADWQMDLYQNGGILYLDAIMTVIENGVQMGGLDADGTLRGEVYTTSAGIINARDWADPQAILTHFNKALYFPPLPGMLVPFIGADHTEKIFLQYGEEERERVNALFVQSTTKEQPEFDVTKGIPTGEQVFLDGKLQKYYYNVELTHYYGTAAVPVEISVTYTYPVKTGDGVSMASFTSSFTYYVGRQYSYYRIDELELYTLRDVNAENEALPVSPVKLENLYTARVTLEQNRDSYMDIPDCRTAVYGGVSGSGGITGEELRSIAENAAGEIWVRNDALAIDGEIILDGSFVEKRTKKPERQKGERLLEVSGDAVTIPHTKQNGTYETQALAFYENFFLKRRVKHEILHVNEVVVHTPVVCKGGITDDIAHNQQITPTPYFSLILGREFSVGIASIGTHKDQPGYGTRDYEKYTEMRQVKFPFEVYDNEVYYAADVWIDLPPEQKSFYLPVGVHEGDYQIHYRTIAKNAAAKQGGIDLNEHLANLSLENYGACDELTVTVVGRMYDLAVTDIVDYPRWQSAFYESDGKKKNFAYWIGVKNLEGNVLAERASDGVFPVLQGDHPYNPSAHAAGLGYRVKLQLKTVGDMRGGMDSIILVPTYYYISRDGSGREQVRLYRKDDLSEVYKVLLMTAENRSFLPVTYRNVADDMLRAQSVQVWNGEYQLSPDLYLVSADVSLDSYIRLHGGRIRKNDPVFRRNGYLLVQFEVRSRPSGIEYLSYVNCKNSSSGYCNMWRLQGFHYTRTDGAGNVFCFEDGDCLLFDTEYSLHSDYESWGTH